MRMFYRVMKEYTGLLQIYSAIFPPNIIEIGQHLT